MSFTTLDKPCPGIPTVYYVGKTYTTVQIGTQCWLKENLDVGSMILFPQNPSNNGTIEKYCYGNKIENCTVYGGLYKWNEAVAYSTTPGTKGICPDGFHIPTKAEFEKLKTEVHSDDNALKAIGQGTGNGIGTNASGFSALLAGYQENNGVGFMFLRQRTYFWSSTEYSTNNAYCMVLIDDFGNLGTISFSSIFEGRSVRCIKD